LWRVAQGVVAASPDIEKQGFFAVVFIDREYSECPDRAGAFTEAGMRQKKTVHIAASRL
jgi:hypothetical protein